MTPDQNRAIALIIPLIVKNNAGKVAIALRDAGYSKDFIPASDLEARLFQLYIANPTMFFEVMKSIPWNYGEAETNKPEIRDELINLVTSNTGYQVSKDNWWKILIALLGPAIPAQERISSPVPPSNGPSFGIVFLIVVAAIALLIGLIWLFKL